MKVLKGYTPLSPFAMLRAFLVVSLLCWALAGLILVIPIASPIVEDSAPIIAYLVALSFAATAAVAAAAQDGGPERAFWGIVAAGLLFRFVGDAGWGNLQNFEGATTAFTVYDAAYVTSYLLFFAALLWLVARTVRRITPVAAMDALSVMFSVGLLAWYFVLGPAADNSIGLDQPQQALRAVSGFACAAAFLSLSLIVGSATRRPPLVPFLAAAFLTFLVAEGSFIRLRSVGIYEPGGWPDLAWALSLLFLGVGALKSIPSAGFAPQLEVGPSRVFLFWLGPLSPAVHITILLLWGAAHPPLPAYALLGGAIITIYLAFRTSIMSQLMKTLRQERERLVLGEERSRLSEELHDSLKQNIHSLPLILGVCQQALKKGSLDVAGEVLDRAMEVSREASHRVSVPIWELRAGYGEAALDPALLVEQMLRDTRKSFGIKVYEDTEASLTELRPEELAAACRIISEALWNAAKHSAANNIRFETRKVGSVFLVKVRDDGRGFRTENPPPGLGLSLMRQRAEEVGGKLDIGSRPGQGTTVQLRFDKQ